MNDADIRVIERGGRARLAQQVLAIGIANRDVGEKFKRNRALEFQVQGFVDDAHASGAQLLGDPVMRDGLAKHGDAKRNATKLSAALHEF